jgi:hypothetical protein
MENNNIHTNINGLSNEDRHLLLEFGKALLHKAYPTPNAMKEWEQFKNTRIEKKSTKPKSKYFISIGIAAAIAILLFIYISGTKPYTIMAFHSNLPQQINISNINGFITVTTPRNKDYKLTLNDGTMVTINANSKFIYPVKFVNSKRIVTLQGEAYFKVKHDEKHPFIVNTASISTRVLGTEFNLSAYSPSTIHVTLIKGSVLVEAKRLQQEIKLKPGQDAALYGHKLTASTVDTDDYTQWKDGYFYFDNQPLIKILEVLGSWYNVDVDIMSRDLLDYRFHFVASRNAGINEIIDNLNSFGYITVSRSGNKLIVSSKK